MESGLNHKGGVSALSWLLGQLLKLSSKQQLLLLLQREAEPKLGQLGRGEIMGGASCCEEGPWVAEHRGGAAGGWVDANLGGDHLDLDSPRMGVGRAIGVIEGT